MSEQKITTQKKIKVPGPAHPITIERNPNRVVVSIGGTVLADSRDALILREAGYAAVQYIPRKDVDMTLLKVVSAPSTPYGPTRLPTTRWRPSGTTWLSTQTGWTRSRSVPIARPRAPASRSKRGRH
jgi:hypothetical protein